MLHTTHKYSVHGAHTHKGMHTPSHNNYRFATRLGYNAKGRREDLMLFLYIWLSNIELKREQLAAIRFLYNEKDVSKVTKGLWEISLL